MKNAVGKPQTVLLLGGTSDIGLAIVKKYLERGPFRVILAARANSSRIDAAKDTVTAAGASEVEVLDFDATDYASHPAVIDAAFANGDVDVAIVAFGQLGDQEELWQNQAAAVEHAQTNFTGPVSVGVLLGNKMRDQGHGAIIALSSVAGTVVRRSNFVYGSTKAGMDSFYRLLGEALRGTGVTVTVVRPGQVRTTMTEGLEEAPLTVNAEDVAEAAVRASDDRKPVVWVHPLFQPIIGVLSHVPQAIMRKLPF